MCGRCTTLGVQHESPRSFVAASFLSRRIVGMVLLCDVVEGHHDAFIPANVGQWFPTKKICLELFQDCAALLSPGLFEHIVGFVVDVLPHKRSVSSSMGRILLNDMIGD